MSAMGDTAVVVESPRWRGSASGLVGVAIFSVTLPATRIAVAEIDSIAVGIGRAVIAGCCALLYLTVTRAPWPRGQWHRLALVAAGVVFGFPLLTSLAMQTLPATHGAIVIGLLPLATAVFALILANERPTGGFWIAALLGSATVLAYAGLDAHGLRLADALLIGAVVCAGIGYAEGGRLSRTLGGPQVIAWALMLSLPAATAITGWRLLDHPAAWHAVSWQARAALAYLGLFSMFIGFLFWYRGLAAGGVARVGQLQLLQPFLSVIAAALLVGEFVELRTLAFAAAVAGIVAAGRRAAVVRIAPRGRPEARPSWRFRSWTRPGRSARASAAAHPPGREPPRRDHEHQPQFDQDRNSRRIVVEAARDRVVDPHEQAIGHRRDEDARATQRAERMDP